MIIGLNCFGDDDSFAFQTLIPLNQFYRLELSEMVLDEVYVDENIINNYNSEYEEWSYDTILLGKFQNNLEAGNLNNDGVPIEYIRFRKRRKSDLSWQNIATFEFDKLVKIYQYIDRIVQSTEEYEYMIVPLTSNVMGNSVVSDILCEFDSTFVVDKNTSYQLLYNLEYDDIEHIVPSSTIETFSKYPTTLYSGQTEYRRSNIKTLVLSENTVNNNDIDARTERINRDNLINFLNNRKPKILKDYAGRYYMVTLSNVKESPNNNLGQAIADISFDFVECGNPNDIIDLQDNNLLESEV